MQYTDDEIKDAAQRATNSYIKIANQRFRCKIPEIQVNFDLCEKDPTSGARAHSSMKLEYNFILLKENLKDFLNNTIPHEVAHLVQFKLFDLKGVKIKGHGAEWREIMKQLACNPDKFHKYDTKNAKTFYKEVKKKNKINTKSLFKNTND